MMVLISDENYKKSFLGLFRVCLASFSDPITQGEYFPYVGLGSPVSPVVTSL